MKGRSFYAVAALLWAASILISGLGVYVENHAVQVPLIHWLNDPSLYPGDPFVASLARYPSALWRLTALAARAFPLGPLLLVLHAFVRILGIGAAGRLALAFSRGSRTAATAAMALFAFVVIPFIGSGVIVNFYFEQSGMAVALILLAIAAFHEERRIACAVWLGLAVNANPLYATFAASYLGAVFLLDRDYRKALPSWIPAAAVLAVLSAYPAYLSVSLAGTRPADDALWLDAARARCWRHLFPADWSWAGYAKTAALAALLGFVVWRKTGFGSRLGRHAMIWTGVAAVWLATAFAAAYVFVSPRLLMLQPARALDVWLCVAAATIFASSLSAIATGAVFLIWMPLGWPFAAAALAIPPLRRRLAAVLMIWVVLVGVHHSWIRIKYLGGPRAAVVNGPPVAVAHIAAWAKTTTAKDDAFLVNVGVTPNWEQFRGLSERSIFTNWEDGTAIYWDRGFVTEWTRRLADVGLDRLDLDDEEPEDALDRIFADMRDDQARALGRKYRLRYWVVEQSRPSELTTVFTSDGYKVLLIGDGYRYPSPSKPDFSAPTR